jgi:DNA-binding NarL/FixJ family response regulator
MANAKDETKKIPVLILLSYELERDGLQLYLEKCEAVEFIADVAESGYVARQKMTAKNYDLLILEYRLPDGTGDDIARELLHMKPGLKVIVLSRFDSPYYVEKMKTAGVHGYVHKADKAEELIKAVDQVMKGAEYFSERVYEGRGIVEESREGRKPIAGSGEPIVRSG